MKYNTAPGESANQNTHCQEICLLRRLLLSNRNEELNASERDEEVPAGAREEFVARHPLEYAIYNFALNHYKNG